MSAQENDFDTSILTHPQGKRLRDFSPLSAAILPALGKHISAISFSRSASRSGFLEPGWQHLFMRLFRRGLRPPPVARFLQSATNW